MQGLFVAGTGPDAGELEVGSALRSAAGGSAATFEPSPFDAGAPPAIAARHAGNELDPASLVEAAKGAAQGADPLIAVTSGGFMAPLSDRYLNRDLALELRLPIVIAAPAAPGLFNGVVLTLEAARGTGLPVAAVVISRWPEQPPRVLLDERGMLERLLPVPVVTAPADGWPVAEWVGGGGVLGGGHVSLDPYVAWEERPVADPRAAGRPEIMSAIHEIVAAEGPMRASRAYALYNRASGGKKLTSVARTPLSSAVYWLAQERKVVLTSKDEIPWQDDDLIRLPDTPPVQVRELGPRTLEEVPLDEIAELIGRLRSARGISDATEMKRAVLSTYGLMRLTSRADEYLGLALDLAG
jgi:dethiobiotin synthetase